MKTIGLIYDRYNRDINKVLAGIEKAKQVGLRPIKLNCVIEKSQDEPDAQLVKQFAKVVTAFDLRVMGTLNPAFLVPKPTLYVILAQLKP